MFKNYNRTPRLIIALILIRLVIIIVLIILIILNIRIIVSFVFTPQAVNDENGVSNEPSHAGQWGPPTQTLMLLRYRSNECGHHSPDEPL